MRRKNLNKGDFRIYFIFGGILLFLLIMHLYISTKSVALKYEVAKLKIGYRELKGKNRFLAGKVSAQESLTRIESKSAKALNMHYPEKVIYIVATKEAK